MEKHDGAMAHGLVAGLWIELDGKLDVELPKWWVASTNSKRHSAVTNRTTGECTGIDA